jgi:hypothetical protein
MSMADAPARIQRRRTKGSRIPPGAVYCGRPGPLGNPFPVDVYGADRAVDLHRRWLTGHMSMAELDGLSCCWDGSLIVLRQRVLALLPDLRGLTLVCWCGIDGPCHVDTLLEIANG